MIRLVHAGDAAAVAAIYNHYVLTSTITFEEEAVTDAEMARRIQDLRERWPWYVCERDGAVVGYAYATPWRARSAYRFSVESTVYVAHDQARKGIGTRLYRVLLDDLRGRGINAVLGGITQPNIASVRMHEALGFERVALFRRVGYKFKHWIDVGYWGLELA